MSTIRIALFAFLATCSTSAVWAQYGLYGSPETLRLPQQEATPAYATPVDYPTTATPAPQPAPTYYPRQPQYRYPAQSPATTYQTYRSASQYRYPAQPPATAMYQPYQPGAQYRYPGPYTTRPPVRTAAVEQPAILQPMPAPPGMSAAPSVPAPTAVPAPQGSGMMNQMLAEQDCYGGDNGCGGVYRGAVGRFEQSACGPYADGCGYDSSCDEGYYCPWYASAMALVMGRSENRRFWTSYAYNDDENQLANNQFGMNWRWGGEVRFGRRFCCGCVPYALEATYWTLSPFSGYQNVTNPGGYVSTQLNVSQLYFNGASADGWFERAEGHRLWRREECHNIEINLIREQLAWACDSPWDIGWSVGVRYFRYQDYFQFGSVAYGHQWGELGYEAYLSDNITNNLMGVQFGFDAAYNVPHGLRLFITPKVGLYDNYMEQNFRAHLGDGTLGTGVYGAFPVNSARHGIAFLTQIDVGADWQFTRNWSARLGYRVVAVTGMGLADDQFPQYIVDKPEIANIQHCSSLVLHGAFIGLTYNF